MVLDGIGRRKAAYMGHLCSGCGVVEGIVCVCWCFQVIRVVMRVVTVRSESSNIVMDIVGGKSASHMLSLLRFLCANAFRCLTTVVGSSISSSKPSLSVFTRFTSFTVNWVTSLSQIHIAKFMDHVRFLRIVQSGIAIKIPLFRNEINSLLLFLERTPNI